MQKVDNPTERVLQTSQIVGLANHTILISKNGEKFQIADSAAPIKTDDGKILGVVLVFRDVDKEYRMQAELMANKEKYKLIYETSSDAIMTLEPPNWRFSSCNKRITEMFGVADEKEFLSLSPWDLSPESQPDGQDSKTKAKQMIEIAMEKKENLFEWTHKKIDGNNFFTTILLSKINLDGKIFLQARVTDITKKVNAEQILRKNEEKYRILFENSSDAMLIIKNDKFIDCNVAAAEILGYTDKNHILNTHPSELSPEYQSDGERSADKAKKLLETTLRNGSNHFEWDHKKMNGDVFPVDVSLTTIRFAGETFIHTAWRDITLRKQAEQELIKMQKLKSIGTLAGGIAHDFNNVLLGIFGNLSLAKINIKPEHPAHDLICEAEKAAKMATRLTNQLLTFSKGGVPVKEQVDLLNLVKETTSFNLAGSNVRPQINCLQELPYLDADKGQIEQVISNLVINANQAMENGGTLFIDLKSVKFEEYNFLQLQPGEYVKLTIKDEGCGMSPEILDHIFDPYFSTKRTGNGIGLATVYSIVDKHKGHIGVTSKLGKGSEFTIHLPAAPTSPKENEENVHQTKKKATFNNIKILVMDDEKYIRELVSKTLLKLQCEVETAQDGEQAINLYKDSMESEKPFDLVLMDLTIPGGMGGKEAVKKLLELDSKAKVVVFSGYSTDETLAEFDSHGFKGMLRKPFTMDDLIGELSRILIES